MVSRRHARSTQGTRRAHTQSRPKGQTSSTVAATIFRGEPQAYAVRDPSPRRRWIYQRNKRGHLGRQSSDDPKEKHGCPSHVRRLHGIKQTLSKGSLPPPKDRPNNRL